MTRAGWAEIAKESDMFKDNEQTKTAILIGLFVILFLAGVVYLIG